MPPTTSKEELQERAQLVRIHEANCGLDHPTEEELRFRIAIMRQLGDSYKLREMRNREVGGPTPAKPAATTPNPTRR